MNHALILPMSSVSLVFGMDWLPLISASAQLTAYRMARQYRATHLVFSGEGAAAVGVITLKTARSQRKRALHSAAQNVAQSFSTGTVALLLELQASCHWLVAVHEGAVVARTDKLYPCVGDAQSALDELKQAYPQLVLLGSAGAPEILTLPAVAAASSVRTALAPVNRWHSALPLPIQWFVLILVLTLLAPRIWAVLFPVAAPVHTIASADPVAAWKTATERAYRGKLVHGVHGTGLVLDALQKLPVRLAGWRLTQASCTAHQRMWRCEAFYNRHAVDASNDSLLAQAPGQWNVQFTSMDQAKPVWTLGSAAWPLAQFSPKSTAHNDRYLLSSLQTIKPAFSQLQLGKPQPVPVVTPRDSQGREIPRPVGVQRYMTRTTQISGPLRSSSLLLPYTSAFEWKKISLSLNDLGQAGLKTSRIRINFQGVLYETETVHGQGANPASSDTQREGAVPAATSLESVAVARQP